MCWKPTRNRAIPIARSCAFQAKLAERGVTLEVIHTSGHASIADLKRLAEAMAPDVLVPVHTFEGDRFSELFGLDGASLFHPC